MTKILAPRFVRRAKWMELPPRRKALIVTFVLGIATVAFGFWIARPATGTYALSQINTSDVHSLAFDPTDPNTVYLGHHNGLIISRDGGKEWHEGSLQGADTMELSLPLDASRWYVAGHDLFRISIDHGKTWRNQPTNLPGLDLHSFAASPTDALRLYVAPFSRGLFTSSDGGVRWQSVTMPAGQNGVDMMVLSVGFDDPLHLYAGAGNRLAESRDGGKSWREIPGPPGVVTQLAAAPSGALYVGTPQGLSKRGANGTWQSRPVPSGAPIVALTVSPAQPEHVAMVDEGKHFFRSDDGGQTWAKR